MLELELNKVSESKIILLMLEKLTTHELYIIILF